MVDWKIFTLKVMKKTWKYFAAAFTGYEVHEQFVPPETKIVALPMPPQVTPVKGEGFDVSEIIFLLFLILGLCLIIVVLYIGTKCIAAMNTNSAALRDSSNIEK